MIIAWLAVLTIISVAALTLSVAVWKRLPRQSAVPPAYPLYPPQPPPYSPVYPPSAATSYPTQPDPPTRWEHGSRCTGLTID